MQVWITSLCLLVLGSWILALWSRGAEKWKMLTAIVLFAFLMRVVVGTAVYYISLWELPIFPSIQSGGGFWVFGMDSLSYHTYGKTISEAWQLGVEIPNPRFEVAFFAVVASIYRVLGVHVLYPVILNCWLYGVCTLLAFRIGRRWFNEQGSLIGALLVAFWPSSFFWSTQILKESLSWCLTLFSVWIVMEIATSSNRWQKGSRWSITIQWTGLIFAIVLLTQLRHYLGVLLLFSALAVFIPYGLVKFKLQNGRQLARLASLIMVLGFSTIWGRSLNTLRLISPSHPEIGHYKLGLKHLGQDELEDAALEFSRALVFKDDYEEAYVGLYAVKKMVDERKGQFIKGVHTAEPSERTDIIAVFGEEYSTFQRGRRVARITESTELQVALQAFEQAARKEDVLVEGAQAVLETVENKVWLNKPPAAIRINEKEKSINIGQKFSAFIKTVYEMVVGNNLPVKETTSALVQSDEMRGLQETFPAIPAMGEQVITEDLSVQEQFVAASIDLDQILHKFPKEIENVLNPPGYLYKDELEDFKQELNLDRLRERLRKHIPFGMKMVPVDEATSKTKLLTEGVAKFNEAVIATGWEASPHMLAYRRKGFVDVAGHSVMNPEDTPTGLLGILAYMPKAFKVGIFAPYPSQWLDTGGSTGGARLFAMLDMIPIYLLFPWMFIGFLRLIFSRRLDAWYVLAFTLMTCGSMSFVVANLGTLFRLRLHYLFFFLIFAGGGLSIASTWRKNRKSDRARDDKSVTVSEPAVELVASER